MALPDEYSSSLQDETELVKQTPNRDLVRPDLDSYRKLDKMPVILILDNVRSGLNTGAIFRTADAFAVKEVVLCGITARPPHPEILKTALGATESVDWSYVENTLEAIEKAKNAGYRVIAIEQTDQSVPLHEADIPQLVPAALVLGNEMKGIQAEVLQRCDASIEIPQSGIKHSLNVATTAGIVLWAFYGKHYLRAAASEV